MMNNNRLSAIITMILAICFLITGFLIAKPCFYLFISFYREFVNDETTFVYLHIGGHLRILMQTGLFIGMIPVVDYILLRILYRGTGEYIAMPDYIKTLITLLISYVIGVGACLVFVIYIYNVKIGSHLPDSVIIPADSIGFSKWGAMFVLLTAVLIYMSRRKKKISEA